MTSTSTQITRTRTSSITGRSAFSRLRWSMVRPTSAPPISVVGDRSDVLCRLSIMWRMTKSANPHAGETGDPRQVRTGSRPIVRPAGTRKKAARKAAKPARPNCCKTVTHQASAHS